MSIPFMLAAMVLTTILGLGIKKYDDSSYCIWMDGYCQTYKRKYTSSKKNEQYVMAAKALGVSDFFCNS